MKRIIFFVSVGLMLTALLGAAIAQNSPASPSEVVKAYLAAAYGGRCNEALGFGSETFKNGVDKMASSNQKGLAGVYSEICPAGLKLTNVDITKEDIHEDKAQIAYTLSFDKGEPRKEIAMLSKIQGAWKIDQITPGALGKNK